MGKRNLYPNISTKTSGLKIRSMMDILSFCDGFNSINDISHQLKLKTKFVYKIVKLLKRNKIINYIN